MRYILPHIQAILEQYQGTPPLSHFLKAYCKQYPVLGSNDRKILSEIVYAFYRTHKAIVNPSLSLAQKTAIALLLTGSRLKQAPAFMPQEWQSLLQASWPEKITCLHPLTAIDLNQLFPWPIPLSAGIARPDWLQSMLEQPPLFIRIRPGHQTAVLSALQKQQVSYQTIHTHCLALPNGTAIDKLLPTEQYVIQDAGSQATGQFLHPQPHEKWYDCCAGAGGKSLLLKDLQPLIRLTVSDTRAGILHNLKVRFCTYGHSLPRSICADVSHNPMLQSMLGKETFDHILCDVPCSGSGTWARTPEQLYFFNPSVLAAIAAKQQAILSGMAAYVAPAGSLFYITCSVFRQENEAVIADFCVRHPEWRVQTARLINGLNLQSDSMFLAELVRQ